MRNKKQILVIGFRVLVVGAAAFIGARMLNGEVNPFGLTVNDSLRIRMHFL